LTGTARQRNLPSYRARQASRPPKFCHRSLAQHGSDLSRAIRTRRLTFLTFRLPRQPIAVDVRRNLRWLNFTASTPKNVCVRDWNVAGGRGRIDSLFVIEQYFFIGAVRHRHDVDVLEFGSGFAPVAMRQNVVTTNFTARFNFTTARHRPMKQRVKPRHTHTAHRWLDVFQEG